MKDKDIMEFFSKFDKSSSYEEFEKTYRKFNEKALNARKSDVREWYNNIYCNADKFEKKQSDITVWKRDFLDAWSLIRYYREWLEEKERSGSRSDSAEEKRLGLLEQIVDILIDHQGKKEEGRKNYRVLSICVDVFLAYGGMRNGITLLSATCQILKDAESDPECKEYYGEPARDCISDRAYQDLMISGRNFNDLESLLEENVDEVQKVFVRGILERKKADPASDEKNYAKKQGKHSTTKKMSERKDEEPYPYGSDQNEKKGKNRTVFFVALGCVAAVLVVLIVIIFLYFFRALSEIRESSFQNQEEVRSSEIRVGDGGEDAEPGNQKLEGFSREFDSRQSVVASLDLAGDMTADGDETDVVIRMGINSTAEPQVIYRTVSAGIVSGTDAQMKNMEIYEEGTDVRYRTGTESSWTSAENGTGKDGTGAAVFREISERFTEFQISGTTGLGGSLCYTLEGTVSGQTVAAFIPETAEILLEETGLSSEEALPQQDTLEGKDVDCVIVVDAETLLPESAAFDLTEIMQEQNAPLGNDVRKYTAEIRYFDYDSLDMITVPSDVHSGTSGIQYSSGGEESVEY